MGIGHAVVPAAEQAVAEDAAGADGDLAALLLVDDVFPSGFVGCPAGGILRVDNGQNAVPLVALADLIAEKGKRRRHGHSCCRDGTDDILPAQARCKHHAAADDGVDDGGAVVALNVDDKDGHGQMQQKLYQLLWLVDAAAHIVQVHGKGKDKADLCQLRGLEGKAAQLVPGVVVGVTGVEADGQRADGHIADEQRGQHKAPCQGYMHRPHLDKAAVVDAGEQQRDHDAKHRRTGLHQRAAVIADAGNGTSDLVRGKTVALLCGPGGKSHHRHGAAEDAQQQIDLIRSFKILSNAFQESTTFRSQMHTGFCRCSGQYQPSLSYYTQPAHRLQSTGCDSFAKSARMLDKADRTIYNEGAAESSFAERLPRKENGRKMPAGKGRRAALGGRYARRKWEWNTICSAVLGVHCALWLSRSQRCPQRLLHSSRKNRRLCSRAFRPQMCARCSRQMLL